MNEISRRRVAGFVVLGIAILVGTLLFGYLMSGCQATPVPSPEASLEASAPPSLTAAPSASADPLFTATPGATASFPPTVPTSTDASPTIDPARTLAPPTAAPPPPGEPGPSILVPPPIR